MKLNHFSHTGTDIPVSARFYTVRRRCVGTRSAQEVFAALISVHRP